MGKTNWKRVFLGGLVAGIVFLVITSATTPIAFMLRESAGQFIPTEFTLGDYLFGIVISLANGIVAVWLYSAIRPRYEAGPKTAIIAWLFLWFVGDGEREILKSQAVARFGSVGGI